MEMYDKLTQIDFDGDLQLVEKDEEITQTEEKSADTPGKAKADVAYIGPERRAGQRRQTVDRRSGVRFEPDKDDRRSWHDRRREYWDQDYDL